MMDVTLQPDSWLLVPISPWLLSISSWLTRIRLAVQSARTLCGQHHLIIGTSWRRVAARCVFETRLIKKVRVGFPLLIWDVLIR